MTEMLLYSLVRVRSQGEMDVNPTRNSGQLRNKLLSSATGVPIAWACISPSGRVERHIKTTEPTLITFGHRSRLDIDRSWSFTMNYLKSITSTVLSSAGVSFPFAIGERIPGLESGSSIWEIKEGTKKVCLRSIRV